MIGPYDLLTTFVFVFSQAAPVVPRRRCGRSKLEHAFLLLFLLLVQ